MAEQYFVKGGRTLLRRRDDEDRAWVDGEWVDTTSIDSYMALGDMDVEPVDEAEAKATFADAF